MIEIEGLTKRYGEKVAVNNLTFTVRPGLVTGFLGPNGAGKSTTMRMILGLDTPTEGTALIDGRPYTAWPRPLTKVGALLDAKALHPRRSARNHLVAMAQSLRSQRAILAWPDLCDVAGLVDGSKPRNADGSAALADSQNGSYLAAVIGGMTAGLPNHQGFSRIGIAASDDAEALLRVFGTATLPTGAPETDTVDWSCFVKKLQSVRHSPIIQLVPEQSTAAIIVHHPSAKYYTVGESRIEQLLRES